jgi:hypothetical protein
MSIMTPKWFHQTWLFSLFNNRSDVAGMGGTYWDLDSLGNLVLLVDEAIAMLKVGGVTEGVDTTWFAFPLIILLA